MYTRLDTKAVYRQAGPPEGVQYWFLQSVVSFTSTCWFSSQSDILSRRRVEESSFIKTFLVKRIWNFYFSLFNHKENKEIQYKALRSKVCQTLISRLILLEFPFVNFYELYRVELQLWLSTWCKGRGIKKEKKINIRCMGSNEIFVCHQFQSLLNSLSW